MPSTAWPLKWILPHDLASGIPRDPWDPLTEVKLDEGITETKTMGPWTFNPEDERLEPGVSTLQTFWRGVNNGIDDNICSFGTSIFSFWLHRASYFLLV